MRYYLRFAALFLLSLNGALCSLESSSVTLSHTEGRGLGYSQGYTSVDLFLAQPSYCDYITPFIDLRGHAFNDSRFAGNAGAGLRWLSPYQQILGVNFFYDSFETFQLTYQQIGVGFEALSDTWEFHANGYFPFGSTKTQIYTLSYGSFADGFLAQADEQFAMNGADAELGYRLYNTPYINFYAGIGPYYYWGRSESTENAFRAIRKDFFGGRLRASATFFNFFKLEGITTYDSRFKWCAQVKLSLEIPLGGCSCSQQSCASCTPCSLRERLFQPVVRNEMMVINHITRTSSDPNILDPEFEP